ncbi:MAG: ABC transporter substrate-binding protein [Clostridiales bacterium]|nr:ABC transporter substrate-binding protein [Clostridiales bacterium]
MKRNARLLGLLLVLVLVLGSLPLFALAEAAEFDISQPVELQIYLIGGPARDYDMVLEKLNEKTKADLNATVNINWIGWGDFQTKYPLILASGEPVDLIYASVWTQYYAEAAKGAFLDLTELAPKYMPKSYAEITPDFMQQATVDGHLYGIPAEFYQFGMMGYILRGDLMREYGFEGISHMDDYGVFLELVRDNNPEMSPGDFIATSDSLEGMLWREHGFQEITFPLVYDVREEHPKVVNFYEEAYILDFFLKMKEWGDKGYWSKSVLSNKDENAYASGLAASRIHNQDSWKSSYIAHPEYESQFFFLSPYSIKTQAMQDGMAVPASAKNPERALMLLEKLRQDREYYNLLTYGIEGLHFEVTEQNTLNPLDPEGFAPEGYCSWGFKEHKFFITPEGMPDNLDEVNAKLEEMAIVNPFVLFTPNFEPVKNERAAVASVYQQYAKPLIYGYIDNPEEGYKTLLMQLEIAGIKEMQAELQRQLDEYIASLAE